MTRISLLILILSLLLASCSGTAGSVSTTAVNPGAYVSPNLDTDYENALNARMQLTLGSLKLAETAAPITAEQARIMLPLWQALQNMTRTGNSAQAEVDALLAQIESAFTAEQLTAIRGMRLASADLQAWAAANNITLGSNGGQGMGQGSGMSPEARATKQAEMGVTRESGGGAASALLDSLIVYLQGRAQ